MRVAYVMLKESGVMVWSVLGIWSGSGRALINWHLVKHIDTMHSRTHLNNINTYRVYRHSWWMRSVLVGWMDAVASNVPASNTPRKSEHSVRCVDHMPGFRLLLVRAPMMRVMCDGIESLPIHLAQNTHLIDNKSNRTTWTHRPSSNIATAAPLGGLTK